MNASAAEVVVHLPPREPAEPAAVMDKASIRKVIFASSIGTIFEYYDFYSIIE